MLDLSPLLADAADPLAGWYGPLLTIISLIVTGVLSGIAWLFTTQRADAKERQTKADQAAEERLKEAKADRDAYLESIQEVIAKQAQSEDQKTALLGTMAAEIKTLARSTEETRSSIEENKRATASLAAEMKAFRESWQQPPSPGKRSNQ